MSAVAVKERPILFSGPMVRAILDGRKTQTRRIIKPQHVDQIETYEDKFHFMHAPDCPSYCDYACAASGEVLDGHIGWTPWGSHPKERGRLWVKETWTPDHANFYPHFPICYRADFGPEYDRVNGKVFSSEQNAWFPFKWRRSIFMPRHYSRITLEITGVRVERLHDITNSDIVAEGFEATGAAHRMPDGSYAVAGRFEGTVSTLRQLFSMKWTEINGAGSWAANPWVWVVEFKRV